MWSAIHSAPWPQSSPLPGIDHLVGDVGPESVDAVEAGLGWCTPCAQTAGGQEEWLAKRGPAAVRNGRQ